VYCEDPIPTKADVIRDGAEAAEGKKARAVTKAPPSVTPLPPGSYCVTRKPRSRDGRCNIECPDPAYGFTQLDEWEEFERANISCTTSGPAVDEKGCTNGPDT